MTGAAAVVFGLALMPVGALLGAPLASAGEGSIATADAASGCSLTPCLLHVAAARPQARPPLLVAQNTGHDAGRIIIPVIELLLSDEARAYSVAARATPASGQAPLEVRLSADVTAGDRPLSYAWDLDGDGETDDSRAAFVTQFSRSGSYPVRLTVTDAAGESLESVVTVTVVEAPRVVASATPTEGDAPLDVSFSATASDSDGQVVRYEWDFDGDGAIDQRSADTANGTFRFAGAGRYIAKVTVTDNDGARGTDSVVISVGKPPVLEASVSPLSGDAPLTVNFLASASDPDGQIARYEWDFNGDGTADFTSAATGNASHLYAAGGVYSAVVSVFDNNGLLATRSFVISVNGPPVALPRAFPLSGEAPLSVTFFSDAADIDGSPEYYDWDYDGDGRRDRRLIASMNSTFTYREPGTYSAELTVEDNDGVTGAATVAIEVLAPATPPSQPAATAAALPPVGGAALTTSLRGSGVDPDGTIVEYAWDTNGDGSFDFVEAVSNDNALPGPLAVIGYSAPLLFDADADGDTDLLAGDSWGRLALFTNTTGVLAAPGWAESTFLLDAAGDPVDVGSYASPVRLDLDGDGLADLLVGSSDGRLTPVFNRGTAAAPAYVVGERLLDALGAEINVGSYAAPLAVDRDADGDLDLLVGNRDGQIQVFIRSGTGAAPVWTAAGALLDSTGEVIDVGTYAAPARLDSDDVAAVTLLVGTQGGQVARFSRSGAAYVAQGLLSDPQDSEIRVGSYATPTPFDVLDDGVARLLVGNSAGRFSVLEASGDAFAAVSDYGGFDAGSYAAPTLVDLDRDGDLDMLVGNQAGHVFYRANLGSASRADWFLPRRLTMSDGAVYDAGSYAAPEANDIDGDGDLDLVVGRRDGHLDVMVNEGSPTSARWGVATALVLGDTSNVVDVGSYASPALRDVDADGDLDLLVGNSSGNVVMLRNDGTASAARYTDMGALLLADGTTLDVGDYAAPVLHDSDGSGTLDLLVGNSNGLLFAFDNRASIGFVLRAVSSPFPGLDVGSYAVPAFADVDADGDLDLLTGNSSGLLRLNPVFGQRTVTFTRPGSYSPVFRVTDDEGNRATSTVLVQALASGSPSASARASVRAGTVPLEVDFVGRGADADGNVVEYAWDFDGDGRFETASPTDGSAQFTYDRVGTFDAVLRVTDNSGKVATATVRVQTRIAIETGVESPQVNVANGTPGVVRTVIAGGEAIVGVRVVDAAGNTVRTLVRDQRRGAGTYSDQWTGRNDAGAIVRDGAYYMVADVTANGETTVIDSRVQADFEELTPSRVYSAGFNPFNGEPVTVEYDIPWPAEVSLYFWTREDGRAGSTIAPVRTVVLRDPRPPGSYVDEWDGFDDNGVLVKGGREYPVTLWLYRLPAGVMLVSGNRPTLSDVSVAPKFFSPAYNPYSKDPAPATTVSLQLSKAATLEAQVLNDAGVLVRRLARPGRSSGANEISWDGRDEDGNLVAPGVYSIGVVATDAAGNRSLPRYGAVSVRY